MIYENFRGYFLLERVYRIVSTLYINSYNKEKKMKKIISKILDLIQNNLPPKMAHTLIHFRFHKKLINWKNPKTYDEKIRWLLVHCYRENVAIYADKYLVRNYVKDCNLEELLIPMYGVWNSISEIDLTQLPNEFILKTTNGSGPLCHAIVNNKTDKLQVKHAL